MTQRGFGGVSRFQELGHPSGYDYSAGSPHLKHPSLRASVEQSLRRVASLLLARNGRCRVLEVGAGHGDFTDVLVGVGAEVVVTEMSQPAAEYLNRRYALNDHVQVVHDASGDWLERGDDEFDLVACISVLHHIPDYLRFLDVAFRHTAQGGAFLSWQDPMWYPSRGKWNRRIEQLAYLAWRLPQGEFSRGAATRWRRFKGVIDESKESDMIEYHVARRGVDQAAIQRLAQRHFGAVDVFEYWSTQAGFLQSLGERTQVTTTFSICATDRLADG